MYEVLSKTWEVNSLLYGNEGQRRFQFHPLQYYSMSTISSSFPLIAERFVFNNKPQIFRHLQFQQ